MATTTATTNGVALQVSALDQLAALDPQELTALLEQLAEQAVPHRALIGAPLADPGELIADETTGEEIGDLERIIDDSNMLPVHFLSEGAIVQRAVCRVRVPGGFGTGFLVGGSLLMTNNHVIPNAATAAASKAEFNFQSDHLGAAQPVDSFSLDPTSLFVTNAGLDVTLVRVKRKFALTLVNAAISEGDVPVGPPIPIPGLDIPQLDRPVLRIPDGRRPIPSLTLPTVAAGQRWGYLRLPVSGPGYGVGAYYNVIGHPSARPKEVAVQDNRVTGVFANVVKYRTDTEPGNSGSPVFDNAWNIVALHHAGGDNVGGVWLNNEGIRIDRIVTWLQGAVNATVRGELGI